MQQAVQADGAEGDKAVQDDDDGVVAISRRHSTTAKSQAAAAAPPGTITENNARNTRLLDAVLPGQPLASHLPGPGQGRAVPAHLGPGCAGLLPDNR